MNRRPLTVLFLATLAATTAPAGRRTVDRLGHVAVTLAGPWDSLDAITARHPDVLMSVHYTGGVTRASGPTLNLLTLQAGDEPLDRVAADVVRLAKQAVPDQGDAGTVAAATVDGEPAQVVVAKQLARGHRVLTRDLLVRHGGVLYDFSFMLDPADLAGGSAVVDAVVASVRWQ